MKQAEEDYLKTIYELSIQTNQKLIKTNMIADTFSYTDQSVLEMIKRLEQKKLVTFMPYKGVTLTKKGESEAVRMIRAHRLWEVFLTEKLDYSWQDVHTEAELLEHVASDNLINKLDKFLNYPKFCQHGNPIPNVYGEVAEFSRLRLFDTNINDQFTITRVLDYKPLLEFLNTHEVKLNSSYKIINKDDFNGMITIENNSIKTIISYNNAKMIFGSIN